MKMTAKSILKNDNFYQISAISLPANKYCDDDGYHNEKTENIFCDFIHVILFSSDHPNNEYVPWTREHSLTIQIT